MDVYFIRGKHDESLLRNKRLCVSGLHIHITRFRRKEIEEPELAADKKVQLFAKKIEIFNSGGLDGFYVLSEAVENI